MATHGLPAVNSHSHNVSFNPEEKKKKNEIKIPINQLCEFLEKVSIFKGLKPDVIKQIAKMVRPLQLEPGEILMEKGSKFNSIYIIFLGLFGVFLTPGLPHQQTEIEKEGNRQYGEGEVIGELPLFIDNIGRTATVRALPKPKQSPSENSTGGPVSIQSVGRAFSTAAISKSSTLSNHTPRTLDTRSVSFHKLTENSPHAIVLQISEDDIRYIMRKNMQVVSNFGTIFNDRNRDANKANMGLNLEAEAQKTPVESPRTPTSLYNAIASDPKSLDESKITVENCVKMLILATEENRAYICQVIAKLENAPQDKSEKSRELNFLRHLLTQLFADLILHRLNQTKFETLSSYYQTALQCKSLSKFTNILELICLKRLKKERGISQEAKDLFEKFYIYSQLHKSDKNIDTDSLQVNELYIKAQTFRKYRFFNSLSIDQVIDFLLKYDDQITQVEFTKDDVLMKEGDPSKDMFIVVKGARIFIFRQASPDELINNPNQQRILLATKGPGDCIGDMGVRDNAPRSATAIASGYVVMLRITKELYYKFIKEFPQLVWNMTADGALNLYKFNREANFDRITATPRLRDNSDLQSNSSIGSISSEDEENEIRFEADGTPRLDELTRGGSSGSLIPPLRLQELIQDTTSSYSTLDNKKASRIEKKESKKSKKEKELLDNLKKECKIYNIKSYGVVAHDKFDVIDKLFLDKAKLIDQFIRYINKYLKVDTNTKKLELPISKFSTAYANYNSKKEKDIQHLYYPVDEFIKAVEELDLEKAKSENIEQKGRSFSEEVEKFIWDISKLSQKIALPISEFIRSIIPSGKIEPQVIIINGKRINAIDTFFPEKPVDEITFLSEILTEIYSCCYEKMSNENIRIQAESLYLLHLLKQSDLIKTEEDSKLLRLHQIIRQFIKNSNNPKIKNIKITACAELIEKILLNPVVAVSIWPIISLATINARSSLEDASRQNYLSDFFNGNYSSEFYTNMTKGVGIEINILSENNFIVKHSRIVGLYNEETKKSDPSALYCGFTVEFSMHYQNHVLTEMVSVPEGGIFLGPNHKKNELMLKLLDDVKKRAKQAGSLKE